MNTAVQVHHGRKQDPVLDKTTVIKLLSDYYSGGIVTRIGETCNYQVIIPKKNTSLTIAVEEGSIKHLQLINAWLKRNCDSHGKHDVSQLRADILKNLVIDRLTRIVNNLRNGKYEEVRSCLSDSPSGDGYGCDNAYIYMGDLLCSFQDEKNFDPNYADLSSVLNILDEAKKDEKKSRRG